MQTYEQTIKSLEEQKLIEILDWKNGIIRMTGKGVSVVDEFRKKNDEMFILCVLWGNFLESQFKIQNGKPKRNLFRRNKKKNI